MENNIGTVGISDYAQVSPFLFNQGTSYVFCHFFFFQKALGDIVYVGLPEIGADVTQHGEAMTSQELPQILMLNSIEISRRSGFSRKRQIRQ